MVTDPALWIPDYQANIRKDQMEELGLAELAEAQVLVIVNKRDDVLTSNLQGPLVVNIDGRVGMQLVLADKRWSTRHELLRVGETAARAASPDGSWGVEVDGRRVRRHIRSIETRPAGAAGRRDSTEGAGPCWCFLDGATRRS